MIRHGRRDSGGKTDLPVRAHPQRVPQANGCPALYGAPRGFTFKL